MPRRGAVVSITAIGKREPGSVRDAVPAHVDHLYRFALRLTRNPEGARDIVHESVLRALKHESVVRDPQAWLFQIVYRTFISYRRKDERRGATDENSWPNGAELESMADPSPSLITAVAHDLNRGF
jgi:DNA-directed RNA polymerase specialized sigma24 family protein